MLSRHLVRSLTSAQIVDSLLSQGVSFVTLVCRSRIKTKHFDFDLSWVSKYANLEKMAFWQEEDAAARHDMIREARDGGSVNPQFGRALQKWEKQGQLEVLTLTEVTDARFEAERKKWTIEVATKSGDAPAASTSKSATTHRDVDYVVCSTGSKLAIDEVDFLRPILASHPVECVGGLPVLTKDLQWRDDLPLFVMGAYAMLEVRSEFLSVSARRTTPRSNALTRPTLTTARTGRSQSLRHSRRRRTRCAPSWRTRHLRLERRRRRSFEDWHSARARPRQQHQLAEIRAQAGESGG